MKSLDTNIVVRFLVNDDKKQGEKVKALFQDAERKGASFLITTPVLLELLYVLDYVYEFERADILEALDLMTSMPVLTFENIESVQNLLETGKKSKTELEDLLIALVSREAGCETTLTFDKKAAKSDLFELID
jgi:predicted nucleic-acid-binding protein